MPSLHNHFNKFISHIQCLEVELSWSNSVYGDSNAFGDCSLCQWLEDGDGAVSATIEVSWHTTISEVLKSMAQARFARRIMYSVPGGILDADAGQGFNMNGRGV